MSEFLNVAEISAALKISPDTVVRRFSKLKGTVNLGTEGSLGKRRYRTFRWPKHVIEKHLGQPIDVPKLEPKRSQRKDWKERAAFALAKTVKENADDPRDRETFKEIQSHARTLMFVDEAEWNDVNFLYPGEEGK